MNNVNNVKMSAFVVVAACGVMFSRSAHAGIGTVDGTWTFDDLVGSCDSSNLDPRFGAKSCTADTLWFTGGRAGYNTVSGNGFLWISKDQSWNSWNIGLNVNEGFSGSVGQCDIRASVFSTDPTTSRIGEMDVWEDNGGGNLSFLGGGAIMGTGGVWNSVPLGAYRVDQAVKDKHNVLFVFGRHQGEGTQEFIALDNISISCAIDGP